MKRFLKKSLLLLPFVFSAGHATLPDFIWGLAPFGYQNINGVQIQLTEDLAIYANRGDHYQYIPSRISNEAKWIGWDFSTGLDYQFMKDGLVKINAGAGYHLSLRATSFFESDPSLKLGFTLPAGLIAFDWQNNFEVRYVQSPQLDANKFTYYRWEPLLKIRSADEWTKLKISPYFFWQGHVQNKRSRPVYSLNINALSNYKVPFYNEVEAGFQARLSTDLGLGMGDKFTFLSTRSRTGNHRLMTYLTWYFDKTNATGK